MVSSRTFTEDCSHCVTRPGHGVQGSSGLATGEALHGTTVLAERHPGMCGVLVSTRDQTQQPTQRTSQRGANGAAAP